MVAMMIVGVLVTYGARDLALEVARDLVIFLKRPGGQSQFSTVLTSQGCMSAVRDLAAGFEQATGNKVTVSFERIWNKPPKSVSGRLLSVVKAQPCAVIHRAAKRLLGLTRRRDMHNLPNRRIRTRMS